ncbi:MAG TPA: hypothetical protein VGN43_09370 [Steroidobacteraceae bacterium]|nr:hypothetical protein [Steroidobacteraceae bacterium]
MDEKFAKLKTWVATVGGGGGGGGGAGLTVMVNAGNAAELAEVPASISILLSVPTFEADGVPESEPVVVLKSAQAGLLLMRKLTAVPLGALTVGINE